MTFRDIVQAMLRRWYFCLVVLAVVGYLGWTYDRNSGCYTTDTVILFTRPAAATLQPDNGSTDVNVIAFAGAIANEINDGQTTPLYASADAPIYGAGVRQGVLVSLPNEGGQMATSFPTAEIDVQIVGLTPEWVEHQQSSILAGIMATTTAQQGATPSKGHITARIEPLSTQIGHVQPARSSRLMALAAMGLAGLISAGAGSILLDGLVGSARNRRAARRGRRLAASSAIGVLS